MNIGIKYCGGCNSTYDRVLVKLKIQIMLENIELCYAQENEIYDWIILINGCSSSCASYSNLESRLGFININDKNNDNNNLKKIITTINKL